MAGPLANSKHEQVALATFAGSTLAEAAAVGGFTGKWPESHACNILKRPEVRQRLEELHKLAANEKIMTVTQRLIRLSEIARARYDDPDRNGDPIRAIHEMNLMQRIYREGIDVNLQQRIININVVSDAAERATQKIIEGLRTSLETNDIPTLHKDGEDEEKPPSALQSSESQEEPSTPLLESSILTQESNTIVE